MKIARLSRLFNPRTGRCFDVAIDHGFFNEPSFLAGIENLPRTIETLVAAGPDAIQLTVGQAPHLQKMPIRPKPALVLRSDVANVYGTELPRGAAGIVYGRNIVQHARPAAITRALMAVVHDSLAPAAALELLRQA